MRVTWLDGFRQFTIKQLYMCYTIISCVIMCSIVWWFLLHIWRLLLCLEFWVTAAVHLLWGQIDRICRSYTWRIVHIYISVKQLLIETTLQKILNNLFKDMIVVLKCPQGWKEIETVLSPSTQNIEMKVNEAFRRTDVLCMVDMAH